MMIHCNNSFTTSRCVFPGSSARHRSCAAKTFAQISCTHNYTAVIVAGFAVGMAAITIGGVMIRNTHMAKKKKRAH